MRIRTIAAGTAAALALLTGCDSGGGTTGTPTNNPTPTSGGNSGSADKTEHGAPKVKNPLNVAAFEAAPCSVVTAEQLAAFGIPGVTSKADNSVGPGCSWFGSSTPAKLGPGVTFIPGGGGLDDMYANKDTRYEVFEELPPIAGYPAILNLAVDQRKDGNCEVSVGLTDDKALLITLVTDEGSPRFADPCGAVKEFANSVITTIKAGAK